MLVHSVYFWLKFDLSVTEIASFEKGLQELSTIPAIHRAFYGKPAATEKREVVDDSYDYGLVVIFDNLVQHDKYQVHPTHQKFLNEHRDKWEKVQVFDIQDLGNTAGCRDHHSVIKEPG